MKGGKSRSDSRKADSRLAVKKPTKKKKQAAKDPNKPKRALSAFFVFMEDFRKQYKESHPNNKSVAAVGKAGGDEWKSMSSEEKAPFVAIADKRKVEYEHQMKAYNKRLAGEEDDEESDKSKSAASDEEDEEELDKSKSAPIDEEVDEVSDKPKPAANDEEAEEISEESPSDEEEEDDD